MPSGSTETMSGSPNEPTLNDIMEAIAAMRLEVNTVRPLVARVEGIEARMAAPGARLSTDSGVTAEGVPDQPGEGTGEHAAVQVPHQLVSERGSDRGRQAASSSLNTDPALTDYTSPEDMGEDSISEKKSLALALPVFTGKLTEYKDWSWQHEVYFTRDGRWSFICGEEP